MADRMTDERLAELRWLCAEIERAVPGTVPAQAAWDAAQALRELLDEVERLRARVAELEEECANLATALREYSDWVASGKPVVRLETLKRVAALERVAEAARALMPYINAAWWDDEQLARRAALGDGQATAFAALRDALAALDGQGSEEGSA